MGIRTHGEGRGSVGRENYAAHSTFTSALVQKNDARIAIDKNAHRLICEIDGEMLFKVQFRNPLLHEINSHPFIQARASDARLIGHFTEQILKIKFTSS